jgi:GTPase SAR1 family protein
MKKKDQFTKEARFFIPVLNKKTGAIVYKTGLTRYTWNKLFHQNTDFFWGIVEPELNDFLGATIPEIKELLEERFPGCIFPKETLEENEFIVESVKAFNINTNKFVNEQIDKFKAKLISLAKNISFEKLDLCKLEELFFNRISRFFGKNADYIIDCYNVVDLFKFSILPELEKIEAERAAKEAAKTERQYQKVINARIASKKGQIEAKKALEKLGFSFK